MTQTSIGRLLIAGIIPGVLTAALYVVGIYIWARMEPKVLPAGERAPWPERWAALRAIGGFLFIVVSVFVTLYAGIATATETAAVAAGITLAYLVLAGRLGVKGILAALARTARISAMMLSIVVGALILGYFLTITRATPELVELIGRSNLQPWVVLSMVIVLYLILGVMMDQIAILLITLPGHVPAGHFARLRPDLVRRDHRQAGGDRADHPARRHERLCRERRDWRLRRGGVPRDRLHADLRVHHARACSPSRCFHPAAHDDGQLIARVPMSPPSFPLVPFAPRAAQPAPAGVRHSDTDLTRLLPGPWSTMLLADLGAEVIKIENPETGGDPARSAQPRYAAGAASESVYFCSVNRNKRSIALDLKSAGDLATFRRLARDADVVVENFRAGAAAKLGIGYGQLREANPALIYCALTGYGQSGPLAALAGHDLNIAGMSGLLQLHPGQVPAMPNMLMGDYAGAMMVVVGILSALVERERSGLGASRRVDARLSDKLDEHADDRPVARGIDPRQGDAIEGWGGNPRYGIYRTRDGRYVTVSLLEKKFWDAFCRLQGREDLINPDETEADRLTSHGERGRLTGRSSKRCS
ncbi:MAG: CoA transferase [Betaproteobacteria bacterium]|nr:CoA transferase [Betaproteobacteria bacterium]